MWIILDLLKQTWMHFLLACIAAFAAVSLILTIFSIVRRIWPRSAFWEVKQIRPFTIGLMLFCGLAAAWASHVYLDAWVAWYTTPLGPPLELILK